MTHKNVRFRRKERQKHIYYKKKILTQVWGIVKTYVDDRRHTGKLDKGKIHCSCPMCATKSTKYLGKSTNSLAGYSASDRRKFDSLASSLSGYNSVA